MAVTELLRGYSEVVGGETPRATVTYLIEAVSFEAARTAADANIPGYQTFDTRLKLRDYTLTIIRDDALFKAVAEYEKSDVTDTSTADPSFSGTTLGQTEHISQHIRQRGRYGAKAVDNKGAIGFDGKNVQGTDIIVPIFNWRETHYKTDAEMSASYFGTLYELTGRVNDEAVIIEKIGRFKAGEVLFLGASWDRRTDGTDIWDVVYEFAASPNTFNRVYGDITVNEKRGHDHLWFGYVNDVDGAEGVNIKKPVAAYVEEVYDEADLLDLDLDGWS